MSPGHILEASSIMVHRTVPLPDIHCHSEPTEHSSPFNRTCTAYALQTCKTAPRFQFRKQRTAIDEPMSSRTHGLLDQSVVAFRPGIDSTMENESIVVQRVVSWGSGDRTRRFSQSTTGHCLPLATPTVAVGCITPLRSTHELYPTLHA